MNVTPLPKTAHVLIESGRVTGGDSPELIGRWCHMVDFVDEEGHVTHDYIGPDFAKAGRIAIEWARDHRCKVVDRSREEPKR